MTTRGLRLLVLALVASGLVAVGGLTSPALAAGPYTSFSLRGDEGDPSFSGDAYYGPDALIQMRGDAHVVDVQVDGWVLEMIGPGSNGPLLAGQTYTAVPGNLGYGPAFRLWGNGGYCGETTSTVTVRELTTDLAGDVVALNLVFEQHCVGSTTAVRGSVAVGSTIAPVALAPKLSVSMRHRTFRYGDTAALDVRLSGDAPTHDVAIYLQPTGQPEQLLAQAVVPVSGRTRVEFDPPVGGLLTVRWAGAGTFPDLVATTSFEVSAKIKNRLRGSTGKVAGLHLVPVSRGAVLYSKVLPDHGGDCLRFHVQYMPRGRWDYDSYVKCVHLDKHSIAAVRYPGDRRLIGLPIRIRAEFKGDELNTKVKGKWQAFRFIAGRSTPRRAPGHGTRASASLLLAVRPVAAMEVYAAKRLP